MSQGQYVATRPFPTTHRQYEIGDMIDTSRITSSELNAGVISGAIEPAKFIDTAARLAALNPVLGPGVHAYETDTGVHKIGTDGVTRYNSLRQSGSGTYVPFGAGPSWAAPYSLLAQAPNNPLVDACQSGHVWTFSHQDAASSLNDTTDYALGSQSIKIVTLGDNAAVGSGTQARWTTTTPIDVTGKALRVWFKVDTGSWSKVASVNFWAWTDGGTSVGYLWVLIGAGSTATQYATEGEWVSMTLPFGAASTGLGAQAPYVTGSPVRTMVNAFAIEVLDTGAGAVTAHFNGVALVDEAYRLPNGCLTISFDDSYGSVYSAAKAYMDKYGFGGVAYCIADNIDTSGRLSTTALQAMQGDGWEIAGHCYHQTVHDARLTSLTSADLDSEFKLLRKWLIDQGFNGADHYAYPGGVYTSGIIGTLRKYFASARTVYANSQETLPPGDPYRLRAVSGSDTEANLKAYIDQAYANRGWLIINWHDVNATPNGNQQDLAIFQHVMDYAASVGIPVRTPSQIMKGMI